MFPLLLPCMETHPACLPVPLVLQAASAMAAWGVEDAGAGEGDDGAAWPGPLGEDASFLGPSRDLPGALTPVPEGSEARHTSGGGGGAMPWRRGSGTVFGGPGAEQEAEEQAVWPRALSTLGGRISLDLKALLSQPPPAQGQGPLSGAAGGTRAGPSITGRSPDGAPSSGPGPRPSAPAALASFYATHGNRGGGAGGRGGVAGQPGGAAAVPGPDDPEFYHLHAHVHHPAPSLRGWLFKVRGWHAGAAL
jgi:hypothetical protein